MNDGGGGDCLRWVIMSRCLVAVKIVLVAGDSGNDC